MTSRMLGRPAIWHLFNQLRYSARLTDIVLATTSNPLHIGAKLERESVLRALAVAGTAKGASDLLEVSPSFIFSVIKRRGIRDEDWKKPR